MTVIASVLSIFIHPNSLAFGPALYGVRCIKHAWLGFNLIQCFSKLIFRRWAFHIDSNSESTLTNVSQYLSNGFQNWILIFQLLPLWLSLSLLILWVSTFASRDFLPGRYSSWFRLPPVQPHRSLHLHVLDTCLPYAVSRLYFAVQFQRLLS